MINRKSVSPSKFINFVWKNRKIENVDKQELWPIDKLYKILRNEPGGFILIFDLHSCLGVKIEERAKNEFLITYRDPFFPDLKNFQFNTETKATNTNRSFKIQWFGKFQKFLDLEINPSIKNLAKYNYKLELPKNQESIIQQNSFHCGDICCFLAKNSTVTFLKEEIMK